MLRLLVISILCLSLSIASINAQEPEEKIKKDTKSFAIAGLDIGNDDEMDQGVFGGILIFGGHTTNIPYVKYSELGYLAAGDIKVGAGLNGSVESRASFLTAVEVDKGLNLGFDLVRLNFKQDGDKDDHDVSIAQALYGIAMPIEMKVGKCNYVYITPVISGYGYSYKETAPGGTEIEKKDKWDRFGGGFDIRAYFNQFKGQVAYFYNTDDDNDGVHLFIADVLAQNIAESNVCVGLEATMRYETESDEVIPTILVTGGYKFNF